HDGHGNHFSDEFRPHRPEAGHRSPQRKIDADEVLRDRGICRPPLQIPAQRARDWRSRLRPCPGTLGSSAFYFYSYAAFVYSQFPSIPRLSKKNRSQARTVMKQARARTVTFSGTGTASGRAYKSVE